MHIIFDNIRINRNTILRICIGMIFLWFGIVKFFPGSSPAESLASGTICTLTFHVISPPTCTVTLAIFESLIGISLVFGRLLKPVLVLLFLHMLGTLLTFFIFPDLMFAKFPFVLTMQDQYVMKNIIIMAAILIIWPSERTISKKNSKMLR